MTIKTSDVRAFAKAAAGIPTGTVIPVQAFVLLTNGLMIKANSNQYVTYKCDFDGECLVDEKILFDYAAHTRAETIELKVSGKSITLTDGKRPVKAATAPVEDFARPVLPEGESLVFPDDVMRAIGTAARFIEDDNSAPIKSHVFVGDSDGKGTVGGTDLTIGFRQVFNMSLPSLALMKGEAILIGGMKECAFSQNDNWHFFQDGSLTYGWIKSVTPFFDLIKGFQAVPDEFELNRADLIEFLTHATSTTVGKAVVGRFWADGGAFNMEVKDKSYDIDISQSLEYTGPEVPSFGFSPGLFLRLVKAFPADTYTFSKGQNLYYLKSGDITTLIMQQQTNN